MKIRPLLLTFVLVSATLFAQTTPGQTSTDAHQQHHPSTSPTQSGDQQTGGMQMGNNGQSDMGGMAAMKADMQQMQSQIDRMRADAQKVQDPNTRAALMQNVATWEQFLTRMQSHMQMMGSMHGMMGQGTNSGGQSASSSGGCPTMQNQPQGTNPPPHE